MHTAFPILSIVMILVIVLAFRLRYIKKKQEQADEDFWEKERKANSTPAKDISNLDYITIPMEKFPLNFSDKAEVVAIESHLKELSQKKLLNLTKKTNTNLKLDYGVPNLATMQEIAANFDDLTTTLVSYAKEMLELDNIDGAISILEYGVVIKTDMASNYTLLADCYNAKGQPQRINILYDQVEVLNLINQKTIFKHFDQLLGITEEERIAQRP